MRVTAKTQSIERTPRGTMVEVHVVGPEIIPEETKALRARSQAIVDSGVVGAAASAVGDITAGQIKRLSSVSSSRTVNDQKRVKSFVEEHFPDWVTIPRLATLEKREYEIRVED